MRPAASFKPVMPLVLGLALVALTAGAFAQGQGQGQGRGAGAPGGGRMQGMQDLRYVEAAWMAVCFELNGTTQQLTALRPTFLAAYRLRHETMEKARQSGDFSAMDNVGKRIRAAIDNKMKEVLTAQQMAQWQQLQQEAAARGPMGMGRGGPGGGPGGGGGGARGGR